MIENKSNSALEDTTKIKDEIPDEVSEILESMPEDKRAIVERTLIASVSMMAQNSPDSAIAKKLTENHIEKFLDMEKCSMENY